MHIRPATEADLPAVMDIFNESIRDSLAVWIETPARSRSAEPGSRGRRKRGCPVLVADDGGVLGFGSFGPFRPYEGFRKTVEHSVYVAADARGHGAGKALLAALDRGGAPERKRIIVGAVDSQNAVSLALHPRDGIRGDGPDAAGRREARTDPRHGSAAGRNCRDERRDAVLFFRCAAVT